MPDNNEHEELLTQIAAVTDPKAFAVLLKSKATPIYQQVFNEGHASAFGTQKGAKEAAEARATEAELKLTQLQDEFDTYKASKPDVAAIEKQWSDKIKAADKKLSDFKEQVKQDAIASAVNSAVTRVQSILKETIDPDKAEALVDKQSVRNRIQSDDGKSLRILQPDQQIPYAGDNEAQMKALAEELGKGVKPIFILSEVEKGPGKSSVPGGGDKTGKAKWDGIRKQVEKPSGKEAGPSPDDKLDKAFGRG